MRRSSGGLRRDRRERAGGGPRRVAAGCAPRADRPRRTREAGRGPERTDQAPLPRRPGKAGRVAHRDGRAGCGGQPRRAAAAGQGAGGVRGDRGVSGVRPGPHPAQGRGPVPRGRAGVGVGGGGAAGGRHGAALAGGGRLRQRNSGGRIAPRCGAEDAPAADVAGQYGYGCYWPSSVVRTANSRAASNWAACWRSHAAWAGLVCSRRWKKGSPEPVSHRRKRVWQFRVTSRR
jgi:hypothetical protein